MEHICAVKQLCRQRLRPDLFSQDIILLKRFAMLSDICFASLSSFQPLCEYGGLGRSGLEMTLFWALM